MSFRVRLLPSGHEFGAGEHESILDAALRHGLTLPYGCRNGDCGTCKGRLLEGRVDYLRQDLPALAPGEREAGAVLCCQARACSDLAIELEEVHAPAEIPIKNLPCKIVRKELLAHDVMRLYLKLPEAQRLQFFAGQYLDVLMGDGTRRSFSLANAPHDDELLELHIRYVEGGSFTHFIFYELEENTVWRIEAPLGTFFLREDSDRPVIFMGGGTGFAPLKGMLEHAFQAADQRAMHLFWGVRTRADLYLAHLPRRWAREHTRFRYTPVLSSPQPRDQWHGETGLVHEAVLRAHPALEAYDIYMSGPPAMIHAAREAFVRHGVREARIFSDAFEFNTRPGEGI